MKDELVTLESRQIAYIHLIPDEKFYETDQYGNDIAYKSIVGFQSPEGTFKLGTAFDLWFQYDPREVLEVSGATISHCPKKYDFMSNEQMGNLPAECGAR